MSTVFAEIKGHECADCSEMLGDVCVNYMDSQGCHGLSISTGTDCIDLSPQMVAGLVDALIEYQNKDLK